MEFSCSRGELVHYRRLLGVLCCVQVLDCLGKGPQGSVYLVERREGGGKYVLKQVRSGEEQVAHVTGGGSLQTVWVCLCGRGRGAYICASSHC